MSGFWYGHGCSLSSDLPVVNVVHSYPVATASPNDGLECFEASITISCEPKDVVIERLEGYLQDAYQVLDTMIVEAHDPNQRHHLARLARSLFKAIDASSVLPR